MIEFISEHWKILAIIAFNLVELVLALVLFLKTGRKNVINDVFDFICRDMPVLIRAAEVKYGDGNGSAKRNYVLSLVKRAYKNFTGIDLSDGSFELKRFAAVLEDILSTPKKKGDF